MDCYRFFLLGLCNISMGMHCFIVLCIGGSYYEIDRRALLKLKNHWKQICSFTQFVAMLCFH